jgi:integrase
LKKKNITELIEEIMGEMSRTGTGKETLKSYKNNGFKKLEDHFRQNGAINFSEELAAEFIYGTRKRYENGEIKDFHWYYARRSAEIMINYEKTGSVNLRQLIHWNHMHNIMRQKPSEKQLNEKDNIYGLLWKVKQEIAGFGYAGSTLKHYNNDGFDPLMRRHNENGLSEYCSETAERLADEYYEKFRDGLIKQSYIYETMRRVVSYIEEYRENGKLEWKRQPPINAWKPSAYFDEILVKFEKSLLQSGNLTPSTVKNILVASRSFLKEIEKRQFQSFDGITLKIASDCIICASKSKTSGVKNLIFGVRIFLNYLYENSITEVNLSFAVPKLTASWQKNHEGFSTDDIKALLNVPDRETVVGKRDFAIMTLAAQTGLRGIDIVNLEYGDIDWRKKEIRIIQHKTGVAHWIPLEPESGNAVADYILNGRAECDAPNIFIRCRRPFKPLNSKAVSSIVTKNIQQSSLDFGGKLWFNAHSFRRAFGTRLLEAKIPLDQLSQLLGHADIDSSKPYLSASETGLRGCALGLPKATGGAV